MKVIVDAFGGDNAPLEVIKGCAEAVSGLGVEILLTGSESVIKKCAADNGISLNGMEIAHTDEVFDIHDEPNEIIKAKKNTSLGLGLQLLAEGKGDAFVCAGSTGALVMGATFIVKRIKGIKRIAPETRAALFSLTPEQIQNAVRKCSCSLPLWEAHMLKRCSDIRIPKLRF